MNTSNEINELAAALAKAQGEITGALKDSANPFFKSKYADLASCWDACRAPLSKNGLSVVQGMQVTDGNLYLITRLLHATGQWISSQTPVNPKDDTPQGMGSALTYTRRYALTAMVGVAQIDDDANAASGGAISAEIKGDLGKGVPIDIARKHALAMMGIIAAHAEDGDHDESGKAAKALKYHREHFPGNDDLYVAAAEQMDVAKRNIWKNLVSLAKANEKAEPQRVAAGRKF